MSNEAWLAELVQRQTDIEREITSIRALTHSDTWARIQPHLFPDPDFLTKVRTYLQHQGTSTESIDLLVRAIDLEDGTL